ncbi:MAG: NfeD family protein [Methylovulum sp.]|nr:NfeD family protein [Methylovulum sp.]
MSEFELVFWYWWVFALVFLVLEILVTGFFFLWMAAAAVVTGCMVGLIPSISVEIQTALFSVLSITAIMAWKFFAKKNIVTSDHPLLNKRGAQYIGRVFNLYEAIENGEGKIKVDDSIWKVHGKDCDINTKVKVTAVRGTVFDIVHVNNADN